jgi:hypothetical protein
MGRSSVTGVVAMLHGAMAVLSRKNRKGGCQGEGCCCDDDCEFLHDVVSFVDL